ncbi:MAG: NAD(P)-dependent oxidoreductase [Candidatus Pristimantibacillus sp.]
MNIVILGATGRVGRHIMELALNDGHTVQALVRTPEKLEFEAANLKVLQGNVLNSHDLNAVLDGGDVVISALNTDGNTTLSDSFPLLIQAMNTYRIKRLVTVGTAGILQSRVDPDLLRYQSSESKRTLTRAAEEHHTVFKLLAQSELEWTIVCPTYLPDGSYTGEYRVERDYLPDNAVQISVADTAEFTYKQAFSTIYSRARVGIAY